jgi:uncharacterized protein DUF3179
MDAHTTRRTLPLLLAGCLALSLAAVLYPLYVIRPFRAQGARELAIALWVTRWRPLATLIAAIATLAALAAYWRVQSRPSRRALACAAAALSVLLAIAARVNVYERMFHPAGRPSFAAAADARLDGDEKVIAVHQGGASRAYPVRIVSYHHVINDQLDGNPIVATY